MEDKDLCPNCGLQLDFDMYCGNCDIYWAECPRCGCVVNMDEYWNHEQGVCDDCQNENGRGV